MSQYQDHPPWGVPVYAGSRSGPVVADTALRSGLRRSRRVTNWALAALLVAVGASTAQLGRLAGGTHPVNATLPSVSTPVAASGGSAVAASATPSQAAAPSVASPVAVSGGS